MNYTARRAADSAARRVARLQEHLGEWFVVGVYWYNGAIVGSEISSGVRRPPVAVYLDDLYGRAYPRAFRMDWHHRAVA